MDNNSKNVLQSNNYLVIDNFISSNKANSLYTQFQQDIKDYPEAFSADTQCPNSKAICNYQPFVILLCEKVNFMTELMQEPMLPTYTYARLYKQGEILHPHTDRPACEISVTLHLGGDIPWDIWFTKPDGTKVNCNLKPGQAAVYTGMTSKHWREAYKGQNYAQVFLHYVKANGEHWDHFFDRINNATTR